MMPTIYRSLCVLVLLLCGVGLERALAEDCKMSPAPPDLDLATHEDFAVLPNPCPTDISPCQCYCEYNSVSIVLKLTCSGLKGGEELKNVFAKIGVLKTFTALRVVVSTLGDLPADTFNGVTFREMEFMNAGLTSDGGSFLASIRTLTSIKIVESSFDALDWPLSEDFSAFTSLETLFMMGPYRGPTKPLNFPGLTTMSLSIREMDAVDETTFNSLSSLERLFLMETQIETLPADVFRDLTHLRELKVVSGALTTLSTDSLRIMADNLDTIDLYGNKIVHVNPKAFNVSNENVDIDLSRNEIAALLREELEPLVIAYGSVKVEGNTFDCDCDDSIFWIINAHSDEAVEELEGAYDQCNFPEDVDLEVLTKFYEYQCSVIPPTP